MKKYVFFVSWLLFPFGCQSLQLSRQMDLIAVNNNSAPASLNNCGIRVLGIEADPSLDIAIDRYKNSGVRAIADVELNRTFSNFAIWSKDCWTLIGKGFQGH